MKFLLFLVLLLFTAGANAYVLEDKLSFFDKEKVEMRQKIENEMCSIIQFYTKIGIIDVNSTLKMQTMKIILSSDISMLADGRIGEYNSQTNSMTLNESTLSSFNVLRFKDTLSHELVHLIQFANNEFIIKSVIKKPKLFRLEGEAQFFSYLYLLSQNIPKDDLEGEVILRKTPSYMAAFKFYLSNYESKYSKIDKNKK